jgi:hypothetical protein
MIMADIRKPSAPLSGMSLNERLFTLGKLDAFDAAARRRDARTMRTLLQEAQLSEIDAAQCADAILADPKKYGF